MQYTPKYNLAKPDDDDVADITVLNQNTDKIDAALQTLKEETLTPETTALYGLGPDAVPDEVLRKNLQIAPWNKLASFETAGSGNWIAPDLYADGRPYVVGYLVIGGGGGGSAVWGTNYSVWGGGSGYSRSGEMEVTPGSSYSYVIGAGGTAVSATTTTIVNGNNGGSSSFNGIVAYGGGGGRGSNNGVYATGYGAQCSGVGVDSNITPFGGVITLYQSSNGVRINAGVPSMCINLFENRSMLGAGGSGQAPSGGKDPVTGKGGGNAATATGANVTAQSADAPGCGGGSAYFVSEYTSFTATSGAGAAGAVYIYVRGKLT